ncbi:MAG TPA: hypothetical protein VF681_11960, partial [Abditibacteriaceae bacterium]
ACELQRWLGDDALRNAAAAKATAFARERYNWDEIAPRWLGHYRAITQCPVPNSITNRAEEPRDGRSQ